LSGLIVGFVLIFTVSLATAFGIAAAYAAISGILYLFSQHTPGPKTPAQVLAPGNSSVSGD